jgi:hypothetical protein
VWVLAASSHVLMRGGACVLVCRVLGCTGKYTVEWRAQSHILRHYAAKKPLSNASLNDVAAAGARLFCEGLEEIDLKTESPRTVSYHDQQFHLVQRWCARDELIASDSVITTMMDIGSKKKEAFQCVTEYGTRLDGTRLREVTKIGRLHPDPENDYKKKTGRNGAKVLFSAAQEFGTPHRNKHWIVSDSAKDNTGRRIQSGPGGAVAHFREKLRNATADANGKGGHILLTQINCASHIGHNEAGAVLMSLGPCERDEFMMKRRARKEETSGARSKISALLDETAHYVNTRDGVRELITERENLPRQLPQMPTEAETRWGHSTKQVVYVAPFSPRIDTVVDYAMKYEPKRSETAVAESDDEDNCNPAVRDFASRPARLFFTELLDSRVRLDLMILQIYGEVQPKPKDGEPPRSAASLKPTCLTMYASL